jgi:hypothetical protein
MKNHASVFLILIFFNGASLLGYQKTIQYADYSYEQPIKTVKLYPQGVGIENSMAPAVTKLNGTKSLVLEFDDLREDADYYYVRFVHCNSDWTPSDYRDNMIVRGYNEFEIESFEFSTESKTKYVHYRYKFPQFKISGNFLAIVYRNQKKDDIVLTRRFMVDSGQANVGARIDRSTIIKDRRTHQRIDVNMNFSALTSPDPRKDFKIVVRQNQRWDNVKIGLPISFIDENSKVISYRALGSENDFAGGNEFRFFDLSTVTFSGRNVQQVGIVDNKAFAKIRPELPLNENYLQNLDINGKFYVRDQEANSLGNTAEYVETTLSLNTPKQRASIYALGDFNNYIRDKNSLLTYDEEQKLYTVTILLKQGWYDYTYWVDDPLDPFQMDRTFHNTENMYEVFVYFRPMGGRGDQLAGYYKFNYNRLR